MVKIVLFLSLSVYLIAQNLVLDEKTLFAAMNELNHNKEIKSIFFSKNVSINLHQPLLFTNTQNLTIFGNGAVLDGHLIKGFKKHKNLRIQDERAMLIFKTTADIKIKNLRLQNSSVKGISHVIPHDSNKGETSLFLSRVDIVGSALYGVHMDDNCDSFDDGVLGSKRSLKLLMNHCKVLDNGIGALDFDGIRMDERSKGGIELLMNHSLVQHNGGDGIELDEAGKGGVYASLFDVNISDNGFFNKSDLDDGFDIDEAGKGSVNVSLIKVNLQKNREDALDFDEKGKGDILLNLQDVVIYADEDKALSVSEKGSGEKRLIKENFYIKKPLSF